MIITNKLIRADFAGGTTIREAVSDAVELAEMLAVPVAFKFNGKTMRVTPERVGGVTWKYESMFTKSHFAERVKLYVNEYHEKCVGGQRCKGLKKKSSK